MTRKFKLLFLFCIVGATVSAQKDTSATFNVGDTAPPLRVREWIKGTPVKTFEKGKVYVVEFWATWCMPCIASMPHLSGLARKYKGKVTFLAIDVYEAHTMKTSSIVQLKAFVDGMGRRMNLNVAAEDTNFTVHDWLKAYDEESIPTTFVIDGKGRVAWIGYPKHLDTVLTKIMNDKWDIKQESSKRNFNQYLEKLDLGVIEKVRRFQGSYNRLDELGNPDSTLFIINKLVEKEIKLKYAPWMVSYTFSALLRTDPRKAYEFGKQAMITSTYGSPASDRIIGVIHDDSRKVSIPSEIYRLGAECYQAEIDRISYPAIVDMAKKYREMGAWYRLSGDNLKARDAEKKAIKLYRK